jgi:hypothetical protein
VRQRAGIRQRRLRWHHHTAVSRLDAAADRWLEADLLRLQRHQRGQHGNNFTQVAQINYGSAAGGVAVFAMDTPAVDVGATPTITATLSSTFGWNILCQEISGLATGNTLAAMIDGSAASNTGTASPATGGAYSSSVASEYLVAVVGDPGFSATYTETGYTADANNPAPNGDAGLQIGYANSTGGAETMSWAINMTTNWATVLVAFKLFGGGGVATPGPSGTPPNRVSILPFRAGPSGGVGSI